MLCSLALLTMGTSSLVANEISDNFKEEINLLTDNANESFFADSNLSEDDLSLSVVKCDLKKYCENGKLYTEKQVGYDCITIVIVPTCSSGESYDAKTCACKPIPTYNTCKKVCDKVWCDSDGTKYKQELDRKSCSCYNVLAAKVNCNYGEVFDKNSCKCVKKPVTPPCEVKCDSRILCDGKGNLTKYILDDKNCNCKTVSVPKPVCPYDKVYSNENCGCITKPVVCTKTCDTKIYCDGKGGLTTQVLNKKDCKCEPKKVAAPNCPSGKKYNPTTCGCDNAVTPPVYPSPTPPKVDCKGYKISGANGAITISGLTAPRQLVKVFDSKNQLVYSCTGNCKETEVIKNVTGTYSVNIGAYSKEYHYICGVTEKVTVSGGIVQPPIVHPPVIDECSEFSVKEVNGQIVISGPKGKNYTYSISLIDKNGKKVCKDINIEVPGYQDPVDPCAGKGGDKDKDGICASDDCDDSDPKVGKKQIPGSACDDGNPKTKNDKIQSDGCTCAGIIPPPVDPCEKKGGDKDKDGICALDDCDDSDPKIGKNQVPGTKCDDGNSKTINDEIQSDGCTCKGTSGGYINNSSSTGRAATPTSSTNKAGKLHHLYPNPAKGALFINLSSYAGQKSTIHLINGFGKVVQQLDFEQLPREAIELNLKGSESGLHFLNVIVDNEEVITEKVMVNKF